MGPAWYPRFDLTGVQERRALSSKVDDLLRQIANMKNERELAATQMQDSECTVKDLEVDFECVVTRLS